MISEVLLDGHWVLVDQTANFVYRTPAGQLANALDLSRDPVLYLEVSANYRRAFLECFRARSRDPAFWDKSVPAPLVENPLRYSSAWATATTS